MTRRFSSEMLFLVVTGLALACEPDSSQGPPSPRFLGAVATPNLHSTRPQAGRISG